MANTQNDAFNKAHREPTEKNLASLTNAELRFLISKLIEDSEHWEDDDNGFSEACEEEQWRLNNSTEFIQRYVDFEPNNYAEYESLKEYLDHRFKSPTLS